jgi:hypothetical protein
MELKPLGKSKGRDENNIQLDVIKLGRDSAKVEDFT